MANTASSSQGILEARVVTKKRESLENAPTLRYDPATLLVQLVAQKKGPKEPKVLMSLAQPRIVNVTLPTTSASRRHEGDSDVPVGCFGGTLEPKDGNYTSFAAKGSSTDPVEMASATTAVVPPDCADGEFILTFMPGKESDPKHLCNARFRAPPGEGHEEALTAFFKALEKSVYPEGGKKIIAFISPASGEGKAEKYWAQYGLPLLSRSRHTLTSIVTKHRNYAMEYCADLSNVINVDDVVVAVGGDGMVWEVINGLKQRLINQGKSTEGGTADQLPAIALFPAGSGCALATGLDVIKYTDAVLSTIHAETIAIDLMRVTQQPTAMMVDPKKKKKSKDSHAAEDVIPVPVDADAKPMWSFLSVTGAFIAEIDKESEKWRWMGNARFTAYALRRLVSGVPEYHATLKYVPWKSEVAPETIGMHNWGEDGAAQPLQLRGPGHRCMLTRDCPCYRLQQGQPSPAAAAGGGETGEESGITGDDRVEGTTSTAEPQQPSPSHDDDEKWIELQDHKFSLITICRYGYLARDSVICPFAHVADGAIDLCLARSDCGRSTLIKGLIEMEKATHLESMPDKFKYLKASKVLLEPHNGYIMVDGEHVGLHGYLLEVDHQAVRVVRYRLTAEGHQWPK